VSVNILHILTLFRECKYFQFPQNIVGDFQHLNSLKMSLSQNLVRDGLVQDF